MSPARPLPQRRHLFWILELGGWAIFWLAMVAAGLAHWTLGFTFLHKSSLTIGGLLVSLGLRAVYRAFARRGVAMTVRLAVALPLCFAAAGAWMAAHNFAIERYLGGETLARARFPDFGNTVYYTFLLAAWSLLYFGVPAYLDLLEQRSRTARAEELARRARAQALRLQLQPHFLFNALNGVSTLIAEQRNAEANRMLSRLSEFLRMTLEAGDAPTVQLAEELEFARRYLEIERARFGERLRFDFEIEPDSDRTIVPVLLLQPLVENAVRHAVAPRERGGRIVLRSRRERDESILEIEDDGPGLGDESATGVGLANTRERLATSYGDAARLELARGELGGLRVRLRLPATSGLPARDRP